jgi:hypothetical protein
MHWQETENLCPDSKQTRVMLDRLRSDGASVARAGLRSAFPLAVCLLLVGASSCNSRRSPQESSPSLTTAVTGSARPRPSRPMATAIVQLLANPVRFDGSEVAIGGYFYAEASEEVDGSLHLSPDDALLGLGNGIDVSFSKCEDSDPPPLSLGEFKAHSGRYVKIYGKFSAGAGNSPVPGTICSVGKILDFEYPPQEILKRVCPREGLKPVCPMSLQ